MYINTFSCVYMYIYIYAFLGCLSSRVPFLQVTALGKTKPRSTLGLRCCRRPVLQSRRGVRRLAAVPQQRAAAAEEVPPLRSGSGAFF